MCWLIRRKAKVQTLVQTSTRNMENNSLATLSQQVSGKNSESKKKLPGRNRLKTVGPATHV